MSSENEAAEVLTEDPGRLLRRDGATDRIFAVGALVAGGVGLILTIGRWRIGALAALVLGAAGVALLLLARNEIDRRARTAGIDVEYVSGFWTSVGLFAGTAVSGLYRLGADRAPR